MFAVGSAVCLRQYLLPTVYYLWKSSIIVYYKIICIKNSFKIITIDLQDTILTKTKIFYKQMPPTMTKFCLFLNCNKECRIVSSHYTEK